MDFPDGSLEVPYGNTFFNPRESAVVPAKAYYERRTVGWIKRWFFPNTGENNTLKSSGAEPNPISISEIQLDEGVKFRIAGHGVHLPEVLNAGPGGGVRRR